LKLKKFEVEEIQNLKFEVEKILNLKKFVVEEI